MMICFKVVDSFQLANVGKRKEPTHYMTISRNTISQAILGYTGAIFLE